MRPRVHSGDIGNTPSLKPRPNDGVLGVIDHTTGQSHLSVFAYDQVGELTPIGSAIDLGVPNANGVAIMGPS